MDMLKSGGKTTEEGLKCRSGVNSRCNMKPICKANKKMDPVPRESPRSGHQKAMASDGRGFLHNGTEFKTCSLANKNLELVRYRLRI